MQTFQSSLTNVSPLYSATDVMEDAVEPLSQSLSVFLLAFRLSPGNDSTDSALSRQHSETQGHRDTGTQ